MIKLVTANIVGSASLTNWSQAQSLAIGDQKHAFVVLQLTCVHDSSLVDLATVGSTILGELIAECRDVSTLQSLEEVVKKTIGEVSEDLQMAVIVGFMNEHELLIYGKGDVEAYLARSGQLARIGSNFAQGVGVRGEVRFDDVVLLSTAKFSEVITVSKLKEILTRDKNPAEMLAPLVHIQKDSSGLAAIVGVVEEQGVEKKWPILRLKLRPTEPHKVNLWIGGVILLLLVVMIGVGAVRRVKIVADQAYGELNQSVSTSIEEVMRVSELNPDQARNLLSQARGEVEAYLMTDVSDEYRDKARKLAVTIELAEERAFKRNDIKLDTVVELGVLAEGLGSDKVKTDGKGNLIFVDKNNKRLVSMNLVDRSRQIIEVGTEGGIIDVGVSESKTYALKTSGVEEYYRKGTEEKKMIEADEFWLKPSLIELFAGNAYILDTEQGEIWKYPTLGDSFGGRRRWFAVGIAPDLSNVVDMKVVGDIWLLTSTGKIERYSRGAPVNFSMDGFPAKGEAKRLSEPTAVWVSDSLVYVLEKGAGRVVVFDIEGKFVEQYVSSEFGKASDLVVVDDKGYVLIDNVVKSFGL